MQHALQPRSTQHLLLIARQTVTDSAIFHKCFDAETRDYIFYVPCMRAHECSAAVVLGGNIYIRGAPLGVKDTCHHNKTKVDLAKRGKGWHRKERERVASKRQAPLPLAANRCIAPVGAGRKYRCSAFSQSRVLRPNSPLTCGHRRNLMAVGTR